MSSIFLEVGNPKDNRPATFSRFVLPFSYETYKNTNNHKWQQIDFADSFEEYAVRKSYFTKETADVLFNQSLYFRYGKNNENPFLTIEYKGFRLSFNSPQIILFAVESSQNESLLKTGFFVHEFYFNSGQNVPFEILLEVNELFRYKECPFKDHKNELSDLFYAELSKKLSLKNNTKQDSYSHWELILKSFLGEDYQWNKKSSQNGNNISFGDIYADNRTFVWTCAVLEDGTKTLQNRFKFELEFADNIWETKNYGHLVKLLNVDRARSDFERINNTDFHSNIVHSTTEFEREWASEKIYKRWEKAGSFYGFSYHSGAALVPTIQEPPLWKHWGQMYFDIILLLLYTRVSLFRFSNKLTEMSLEALKTQQNENEKWSKSFSRLRWDFTLFTNLFRFPLISNQQQAIEMFDIAKSSLDIDEFYNEIQQEIHSSQEFIEQLLEKERNEILSNQSKTAEVQAQVTTILTVVATIGLIFSIAVAIWSGFVTEFTAIRQDYYPNEFRILNRIIILVLTIIGAIISIVLAHPTFKILKWLMEKIGFRRNNE